MQRITEINIIVSEFEQSTIITSPPAQGKA